MNSSNPLGIEGLAFVELASPTPSEVEALLTTFGFSRTHEHPTREVDLYLQNDIRLVLLASMDRMRMGLPRSMGHRSARSGCASRTRCSHRSSRCASAPSVRHTDSELRSTRRQ